MTLLVGTIIRGRVLLNGDASQVDNVPVGSQLIVRLEDTSIADASAIILKETEISNIVAFPINYQIRVPANISSTMSYTLSARIKKGDIFLYISEENVAVTINTNNPITIDIPVNIISGGKYICYEYRYPCLTIFMSFIITGRAMKSLLRNMERLSWPELVGREGTYAVQYIKEKTGNIFLMHMQRCFIKFYLSFRFH